jgi:hypothetical protein
MFVRLGDNEIRFRVSRSEFESLGDGVAVETITDFGGPKPWVCRVDLSETGSDTMTLRALSTGIGLFVDRAAYERLGDRLPSKDGLSIATEAGLRVCFEVDIRRRFDPA